MTRPLDDGLEGRRCGAGAKAIGSIGISMVFSNVQWDAESDTHRASAYNAHRSR